MSQKKSDAPRRFWDCDNNHLWKSYPGPYKDTWHLEQLHKPTTGTNMVLDSKSAWLVSGPDPSVCPLCALRMRLKQPQVSGRSQKHRHNQTKLRIIA